MPKLHKGLPVPPDDFVAVCYVPSASETQSHRQDRITKIYTSGNYYTQKKVNLLTSMWTFGLKVGTPITEFQLFQFFMRHISTYKPVSNSNTNIIVINMHDMYSNDVRYLGMTLTLRKEPLQGELHDPNTASPKQVPLCLWRWGLSRPGVRKTRVRVTDQSSGASSNVNVTKFT